MKKDETVTLCGGFSSLPQFASTVASQPMTKRAPGTRTISGRCVKLPLQSCGAMASSGSSTVSVPAARMTSALREAAAQRSIHASTETEKRPLVVGSLKAKLVSPPKPPDGGSKLSSMLAGCSSRAPRAMRCVAPEGTPCTSTTT